MVIYSPGIKLKVEQACQRRGIRIEQIGYIKAVRVCLEDKKYGYSAMFGQEVWVVGKHEGVVFHIFDHQAEPLATIPDYEAGLAPKELTGTYKQKWEDLQSSQS